jgi:hypothetical protein
MRNLKFSSFFFLLSLSVLAQNSKVDKVTDAFGKERMQYLQTNYPDSIGYYNFVAEDGFTVTLKQNVPEEILATALPINIPEACINNGVPIHTCINILKLPVKFHPTQKMCYLINGTDYALMIRSKDYLFKKYNAKPK